MNTKLDLQRLSKLTPGATIGDALRSSGELLGAISDILTRTIVLVLRTVAAAIENALATHIPRIRAKFQHRRDSETSNKQKRHISDRSSLASDVEISDLEPKELESDLPQKNHSDPPRLNALQEELTIAEEALHDEQEGSVNLEDIEVKLGLARAYIELGDMHLARAMLDEVRNGDRFVGEALSKNANKAT